MAAITQQPGKRPFFRPYNIWIATLVIMLAVGIYGAALVLIYGLVVTNLTNQVPWGLWITHDLSAIATGAGAFTFSAVVYLFGIKRFEPVARVAVFVGFLGYTSAMLALAMDIGRPDRFWHPLIYWNVHSVLWEITLCVILYSTVLIIEFVPIITETKWFDNRPRIRHFGHQLHKLTPLMAIIGMGLSLLHQSSLGATYGVLSGRAIWYKPSMPVMFILSAVAAGVSATLLATMITSKLTNRELIDKYLRRDVAKIAAFVLLGYLYLKLWDWAATSYYSHDPAAAEALTRLQATTPYSQSFWLLEILLCGLIPAIILLNRSMRRQEWLMMFALCS
jgi:Ni/Fe-hydrogenase subunit HybB-like protein